MANPNGDLLRPPILNIPNPPPPLPNGNIDMDRILRACVEQSRRTVREILNPNADISGVDQQIEERFRGELDDLDRIPDIVRCLREFSGNPGEFSSWKKSVDRVLQLYEASKGTPRYFGILNVVRNKIIGSADAALESYNTPLDWSCISRCLTLHYADKRDLSTLEYQMSSLIQGQSTVQDFYQSVYAHLSLIMNKLACMDMGRESLDIMTQTYRDKALDTFIRGLKGDLPRLLGIREPTDLPQALHLCLKLENQQYRTQYANAHMKTDKAMAHPQYRNHGQPQVSHHPLPTHNFQSYSPARWQVQQYANQMTPRQLYAGNSPQLMPPRQFYTGNSPPQMPPRQFYTSNNIPQRPTMPKPQPRPEPMDIDRSMRTNTVDYVNRPGQGNRFMEKRPLSQSYQVHRPQKMQRNFNIESEQEDSHQGSQAVSYEETMENYEDEEKLQPFEDYLEKYYDRGDTEADDFVDVNFLD